MNAWELLRCLTPMHPYAAITGIILGTGLLFSCSHSDMKPVSPLITHSLHADAKQGFFQGVWYNPREKGIWTTPVLHVYVAPVNVDYVKTQFPKEAPMLAQQLHTELRNDISRVLNDKNKQSGGKFRWRLVSAPPANGVILRTALVKLQATDVGGNIISDLLSLAVPIPGTSMLIGRFLEGDVGLEGRLENTGNGTPVMEFKVYNTDPITLFSVKEFERFAFDRRNIRDFARGISAIFKQGPRTGISETDQFDLNPF